MTNQSLIEDVAGRLLERWKQVMSAGQRARDAGQDSIVRLYQQERQFLEGLLDAIHPQLPGGLAEWESYRQHSPPNIYFSPDSTDVEPRF